MADLSENALISPLFLQRFAEASDLAAQGQSAAALAKFKTIFIDENQQKIPGAITGEFLATVELRKAYCLMDLQRYIEAKAIFEQLDQLLAGQFGMVDLYDFYFSYGNTLGNLGLLTEMEDRMARAMNIATEELQDANRFRDLWYWILHWEKHYQAWELVEEHGQSAYEFGIQNQDLQLQILALEFQCYAHRALGRLNEARQGATIVLSWKQQLEDDPSSIQEWELFLDSLEENG